MQSLETSLIEKDQQIRCKEAELSNAVTAVELLSKKAASFYDKLTSQWRAWSKVGHQLILDHTIKLCNVRK